MGDLLLKGNNYDLILKGWVMLQDTCESCLVPLMKNKLKKIVCINKECEVYKILNSVSNNES